MFGKFVLHPGTLISITINTAIFIIASVILYIRVDQVTLPVVSSVFLMIGFRKKNMFSIDW